MSDAFGNITIYAASVDELVDLIQCHLKYEEGAYYSTSLDLFEDVSPEDNSAIRKLVEENYKLDFNTHDAVLISDFTATGRWSFKSNIGWFFNCLTEDYSKYPNIEEAQSRAKATDITVVFDFTDGESGSDFIQYGEVLFKICWTITSMILERLYLLNGCLLILTNMSMRCAMMMKKKSSIHLRTVS